MSGGVDSSVAASLLAEAGHDVIGLSMQLYDQRASPDSVRLVLQPRRSARRPARRGDARHSPLHRQFRGAVSARPSSSNFVNEYAAGRTPIPCVHCNADLKFATLVERAAGFDAAAVATGHYARVVFDEDTRRYRLLRGVDRDKDQSYFLFSLTQDQLAHAMFPVGPPDEARGARARRAARPAVANKPDSHEICFVPDGDAGGFVERQARPRTHATARSSTPAARVLGRASRHPSLHRRSAQGPRPRRAACRCTCCGSSPTDVARRRRPARRTRAARPHGVAT